MVEIGSLAPFIGSVVLAAGSYVYLRRAHSALIRDRAATPAADVMDPSIFPVRRSGKAMQVSIHGPSGKISVTEVVREPREISAAEIRSGAVQKMWSYIKASKQLRGPNKPKSRPVSKTRS